MRGLNMLINSYADFSLFKEIETTCIDIAIHLIHHLTYLEVQWTSERYEEQTLFPEVINL